MELSAKQSVITPEGVFIIGSYDENGVPNAMNAAWGIQSDYGEITLFLAKHKTTDNIKKTKAFTVAMATKDTVVISDYFGVETGNRVNKIEKAGCHVHKSAHVNGEDRQRAGRRVDPDGRQGRSRQDAADYVRYCDQQLPHNRPGCRQGLP